MYSMYISHENELYLVFSSGEIFKSVEVDEIGFQPYNMINENIRKVCTGIGFEAIVTESNKLLTTFSEKSSARSTNGYIKIPRELKKFANLDILDAVSGSNHMLVHAVHKITPNTTPEDSSMNEFDVSCGEMRVSEMNDLNRTYTKLELNGNADTATLDQDENENIPPVGMSAATHETDKQIESGSAVSVTVSKIPISEQMKRRASINGTSLPSSRKNSNDSATVTEVPAEKVSGDIDRNRITPGSIEKSLSLKEFEKLEQEHAGTGTGEHANETEEKLVNVEEVDERDGSTSTASSHKSTVATAAVEVRQEPFDLLEATRTPPHWIQTPPHIVVASATTNGNRDGEEDRSQTVDEMIESRLNNDEQLQVIVQQTDQGTSIAEIRRQSTTIDPPSPPRSSSPSLIQRHDSEITFIDNGVDVTQDVEDSFGSEPDPEPDDEIRIHPAVSMVNEPMPTADKIVDTLLGEKLLSTYVVPPIMDTKEETKKALEEVFEVKSTAAATTTTKDSPDRDGDSERTTASISSISPDKLQPFVNEVAHIGNGGSTTGSSSSVKESGKVRRFINDLKTKGRNMSCSNSNAIATVVSESKV